MTQKDHGADRTLLRRGCYLASKGQNSALQDPYWAVIRVGSEGNPVRRFAASGLDASASQALGKPGQAA